MLKKLNRTALVRERGEYNDSYVSSGQLCKVGIGQLSNTIKSKKFSTENRSLDLWSRLSLVTLERRFLIEKPN